MSRQFTIEKAVKKAVPLLIGLMGPSGGGKTYSALRLASGIQRVFPGDIIGIDTESNRMLHYADMFNFYHIPFTAPFGSLDYLEVLRFAESKKPSVIIIDSQSHEHEGIGGLLDFQEKELDRLAGDDYQKRQRIQLLSWKEPKSARRKLINGLLQINSNFIFCFRAKESSKPVKNKDGKTVIENFGFVPIAGDEFVFEMTINMLLLPHANGVPTWQSECKGERMMMKLPEQFRKIFENKQVQLDESIGEQLALWAAGDSRNPRAEWLEKIGKEIEKHDFTEEEKFLFRRELSKAGKSVKKLEAVYDEVKKAGKAQEKQTETIPVDDPGINAAFEGKQLETAEEEFEPQKAELDLY